MFPPAVRMLTERRVPQILAIYLASCWGLLEFMQFVTERYVLSPHLVDLALLLTALMIPSVLLLAWNHGRPGQDQWVRSEKVGVPLNAVVTLLAAVLLFGGKPLGAATTSVTVEDEDGNTVTRTVPKAEFRKRLGLFYLDGPELAPEDGWLRYAFVHALNTELAQDAFIDLRIPVLFRDRLREAGFTELTGVPLTLQREVAGQQHRQYFLNGSVVREDDLVHATLRLHETADGGLVAERTFAGRDVLTLTDSMSVFIKDALEVQPRPDAPDLPARELLTSSAEAYRSYVDAVVAIHVRDDWAAAGEALAHAVELDPAFAEAQYALAQVNLFAGRTAEAVAPIQAAMDNLYRLPERMQFMVKSDYYFINQQAPRAFAVLDMWVEVFPEDLSAHQARAQVQLVRDDRAGAIQSLQTVLALDEGQLQTLQQIGALQQADGDFAGALASFERYTEAFPEDHRGRLSLGDLHAVQGQLADAAAQYEQALTLKPGDVTTQLKLAEVAAYGERWAEADAELARAEQAARTPQDRSQVHSAWARRLALRGQMRAALGRTETALQASAEFNPPVLVAAERLGAVDLHVQAGDTAGARAIVERARAELTSPWDMFIPMGELGMALELGDPDAVEAAAVGMERMIATLGYELFRHRIHNGRGRAHLMRGAWDAAAEQLREEIRLDPTAIATHTLLAGALRGSGRLDEAEREVREALRRRPADPEARVELARILAARGRAAAAVVELDRALGVWEPADPGFGPAAEARALRGTLAGGDA